MSRRRLVASLAFLLVLGVLPMGCAMTTPLTHPVGGATSCRSWGWGYVGFPLMLARHAQCVARGEQRGLVAGETSVRVGAPGIIR